MNTFFLAVQPFVNFYFSSRKADLQWLNTKAERMTREWANIAPFSQRLEARVRKVRVTETQEKASSHNPTHVPRCRQKISLNLRAMSVPSLRFVAGRLPPQKRSDVQELANHLYWWLFIVTNARPFYLGAQLEKISRSNYSGQVFIQGGGWVTSLTHFLPSSFCTSVLACILCREKSTTFSDYSPHSQKWFALCSMKN